MIAVETLSSAILWPAVVLALLTLGLFVPLIQGRFRAVKTGEARPGQFKLREREPDSTRAFYNAVVNQFETPVLFYALVALVFVTGQGDGWMVALAWGYVVFKAAQTFVLVTSNKLRPRMMAFGVAILLLTLMWILFALRLALA